MQRKIIIPKSFIDADRDILEPDFGITVTQECFNQRNSRWSWIPTLKLEKAVEKFGDGFLAEEARATRNFISMKLTADTNSVVALSGSNVMDDSGLARKFNWSEFCLKTRNF